MTNSETASDRRTLRLVKRLQRYVRFPSEQTELQEHDPAVRAFIKDCVDPELRRMGLTPKFDPMGNLVVELGEGGSGRSIMFVAYAMTHPAARMKDPFAAALIDTPRGKAVRGRGVAEQKTSLAAICGAIEDIVSNGTRLQGRLVLVVTTAGETGRHDAVASVTQFLGHSPDAVVVCVGTNNKVAVGNKGRIDFDVIVKGKTAHSSAPWDGVNAISGACDILRQLKALDLGVPAHPAFGMPTLTPTAIDSQPKATHTVPDEVRVTFDRRLLPGEAPEQALERIRDAVHLEPPWTVSYQLGPVMYPNELDTGSELFRQLEVAFNAAGQPAPEAIYCNFALDAGYFGKQGIEAVMLGAGEIEQFHSNEEHVLIEDLLALTDVYHHLVNGYIALK